jgi:hypothetical protein
MYRRRILLVLAIVILIGLIAIAAYLIKNRSSSDSDTTGTLPEIGADFASIEPDESNLASSTVSSDPVIAFHASEDGTVVSMSREGKVTRTNGLSVISLSASPIADLASATFSNDGSKILVLIGGQPRSEVNIFDIETASWRVIPGGFRGATWSPRGSQIAALIPNEKNGKTSIAIYDAGTGRTVQTVTSLALGDAAISWPAAGTIIVSDKPNAFSQGSAWAIDVASRRVTLAARGGNGFDAIWDSSGRNGISIEGRIPGRGAILRIISDYIPTAKLAFATVPQKCVFASLSTSGTSTRPYLICAVPRDQDAFQKLELPDAWLRYEAFTDDILIGVNLDTKQVDFSIAPPLPLDATRLQVVGNAIYYTDRVSDKLYRSEI